jgi:hypothetical protein
MWLKILLNIISQCIIDWRDVSWLGFFIDVNLFKANNKAKDSNMLLNSIECSLDSSLSAKDGLADEDSNLMLKLKFLPYKVLHCYFFSAYRA